MSNKIKTTSYNVLIGLYLSIIAFITGAVAIIGFREEWWRQIKAFSVFGWATLIAALAVGFIVYGLFILKRNNHKGVRLALIGLFFSFPILLGAFLFKYTATLYPPINDISTDTIDAPSYWEMPTPTEYPKEKFESLQIEGYPDIKTINSSLNVDEVFKKVLALVDKKGWELVSNDKDEGQIEAVAASLLFGFKDEVVVRIKEDDQGTIVDIRSRSRIGAIDRGANAKRIRLIRSILVK